MRQFRAREGAIGEALVDDAFERERESIGIIHHAVVEPERLFVEVAVQVEGLDRDVGAAEPTLEQRPEVLDAVYVAVARDVLDRVVDNLVLVDLL